MPSERPGWAIILHGGAKEIEPGDERRNREGCLEALAAGRAVLEAGGRAVDAAEAAVRVLEALPVFNAGYGSVLNRAGEVEMDASMMDGETLDIGAVGAVKGVRHPISIAKSLLREVPILLVGEGASLYASGNGGEMAPNEAMVAPEKRESMKEGLDTVGCVAMDQAGNFAVGTSTGGLGGAFVGRVGDSPLPGCGFYADNKVGAVGFSGHGEAIARLTLAAKVMAAMERDGPLEALQDALAGMPALGSDAGGIAISKNGTIAWAHNSPAFAVAMVASDWDEPKVWLHKEEEQAADG